MAQESLFQFKSKKRLLISFSGGRTSAYMMWYLLNEWPERHNYIFVVIFANTGKEHEGTLEFVRRCGVEWNIPIIWVESKSSSKKGWKIYYKIVDFNTASRDGKPFEEMIAKVGIPFTNVPVCSEILKTRVIRSYMRSNNWKNYFTAIGIRSDEIDRVNEHYKNKRLIYPFVKDFPVDKPAVLKWWSQQSFDLDIPEGMGNCNNCWKKDILTLCNNARKAPESYEWWQLMTDKYGNFNPRGTNLKPPFNFYRGNISPKDILELSKLPDEEIRKIQKDNRLSGCSESCEPF